jgi:hypothetical protein
MVPLPDTLKAQTIAAAVAVEAQAGKTAAGPPKQQPTTAGAAGNGVSASGLPSATASTGTTGKNSSSRATSPEAQGAPQSADLPATKPPRAVQQPVAGVRLTPPLSAPAVGASLLGILVVGALAAMSSQVMQPLGRRLRRRLRKGVTPTEQ